MFEMIKKWYEEGLWNKSMVRAAVVKGKITADQYEAITGEAYSAG